MGRPRFLQENFFNRRQFRGHVVAGNEETAGNEAFRVGNSRRGPLDFWTPTTPNQQAYLGSTFDRVRMFDMVVVDRNNNLGGATVRLWVSSDNFTTKTEIFSLTFPTQVFNNSKLDQIPGALSDEGAWAFNFNPHSGKAVRFVIDAMGAGAKPHVGGLWLGQSLQLQHSPLLPWSPEARHLEFKESLSSSLWAGTGRKAQRREGNISIPMADTTEPEQVRYHIEEGYWSGSYMWVVFDDERAERSALWYATPGRHRIVHPPTLRYPLLDVSGAEHQPKPRPS